MYLIDTDVLSAWRRPQRHPEARAWLQATADRHLHLSVMTFGEIWRGIAMARRTDPAQAQRLTTWIDGIAGQYRGRILAPDLAAAKIWAGLTLRASNVQQIDLIIAATALAHGLTVVTRNVRLYAPLGAPVLDPAGGS